MLATSYSSWKYCILLLLLCFTPSYLTRETVDTVKLVAKLESSLRCESQTIHHKQDGQCVTTGLYHHGNFYYIFPKVCAEDDMHQQWKLHDSQLMVGGRDLQTCSNYFKERIGSFRAPGTVLDCKHNNPDCYLIVYPNHKKQNQQFFFKAQKPDCRSDSVYFSIHSKLFPERCLTRVTDQEGDWFRLATCYGNDKQLFYLKNVSAYGK